MKHLALILGSVVLSALASIPAVADSATFNFAGNCLDCSNPQGQLTLDNYTYGDSLAPADLVSFTYTSNLADVSVTQSNILSLTGNLSDAPGSYNFILGFNENGTYYEFYTDTTGYFCYGVYGSCGGGAIGIDHGTNGIFSPVDAAATPEPSSLLLLGTSLLGSAAILRRRFAL